MPEVGKLHLLGVYNSPSSFITFFIVLKSKLYAGKFELVLEQRMAH